MSSTLHGWIRLWSRLSGRRLRREVDDELDFHVEMLMRRFEAQGMTLDRLIYKEGAVGKRR